MIETFAALLAAHVLADFLFQTGWMVRNKRRPAVLALHGVVVFATAWVLLGPAATLPLLALAAVHVGIDIVKLGNTRHGVGPFLADQGAHLVSVLALAMLVPGLWSASPWAALPGSGAIALLHGAVLLAGFVAATRAGGFAVGILMAAPTWAPPAGGLADGGRMIGLLERGLIFLLVLAGQTEAIGFLIAAKSILRFGTVGDDRAVSEYVIIGTLASFGWALAASLGTVELLAALPPLVIPPPTP
jgi:hypothetical protein